MGTKAHYRGLAGVALALAVPCVARADDAKVAIALNAGRLADALQQLSVKSRTGLLFAPDIVGDRISPRVTGKLTIDQILQRLLEGSGLAWRRTTPTSFIIYARPGADAPPAIPEILVVGRRSQNADIARSANDIQPYQIISADDVASAHADDVDDLLRSRLPSEASLRGPAEDPYGQTGSNRSELNLHGLGSDQTLVLVDGARMPSVPSFGSLITLQPDLNGIPLFAIDRIETLTATAGGIFGPGATGGVVNVILKRDYRGADLAVTYGLTSRGDAPRRRIDGRIGFTPDHGRTDIMLTVSHNETSALPAGNRDYAVKARAIEIAQNPAAFLATYPTGNGVIVESYPGGNLSLKPAYGGAQLGSGYTYLPLNLTGAAGSLASALTANAGQIPAGLAPDGTGAQRDLTNATRVTSILFNLRHHFGNNVEAFVDLLAYQNDGRATGGTLNSAGSVLPAFSPINPFAQTVIILYPTPGLDSTYATRLRTFRLSTGLLVRLGPSWRADVNFSLGGVHEQTMESGALLNSDAEFDMAFGRPLKVGEPALNPFGNWAGFVAALPAYIGTTGLLYDQNDRFRDASLRLAGPVTQTLAGPITLSLLAEQRREEIATGTIGSDDNGTTFSESLRGFTQTVSSLYGEARAPLIPRTSGPWLLRGLELQLAIRYDDNRSTVPSGTSAWLRASEAATAYTAGLKAYPQDHLLLRGSVSTGILPPTPAQLVEQKRVISIPFFTPDPERGGRIIGSEAPFTELSGGSLQVQPERARTMSVGLVLNPEGGRRMRLSLDLTHITKTNEIITDFTGEIPYFITNEALYPGRITRAPLTAADAAAGFTGGVITQIDTTYLNIGRTWSDSVDFRGDYTLRLYRAGAIRLNAVATWQPRLDRRVSADRPIINYVGTSDGPLRWRGNAGIDWLRGSLTLGLNGQYYGGYSAVNYTYDAVPTPFSAAALNQPGVRIAPQFYLDFSAGYRWQLRTSLVKAIEFRFGVQDLLDHAPPIATNSDLGYSFFGDPRRRRFELTVGAHF